MTTKVFTESNPIGEQINKENRSKAKEVLKTAKEIEADLISKGAIWMKKERNVVLVPKHKIKKYKSNGYR